VKHLAIILVSSFLLHPPAFSASVEVWLTPERKAALNRIASRPRVIAQERGKGGEVINRWTNGSREWATTNRPGAALGKRSVNAWQQKLDAKDREKQSLLDDLKAVKDKPAKKDLEAIINKHSKKD